MTLRLSSTFAALVLATTAFTAPVAFAKPMSGAAAVKMIDTDNDGTVDMKEIEATASATFDRLEKDADGTLDKKEDLAAVADRFKAADPDGDGTLDAKELKSPAGKALLALIK